MGTGQRHAPTLQLTSARTRFWRVGDVGRFSEDTWAPDRWRGPTSVLAQATIFAIGFDVVVLKGASIGLVLTLLMTPLWLPSVRRYTLAPTFLALAVLSIPSGFILSELASIDHAVSGEGRLRWFALIMSGVAATVMFLWTREFLPLPRLVLLYGLGALTQAVLFSPMDFKFDLAIPLTIVALGLAEHVKNRFVPAAVLGGLGAMVVVNEGRSYFAFCLVAVVLTLWQMRPTGATRSGSRWRPIAMLAGLCFAVYMLVSTLLTSGAFGATLQERSTMQISSSGSLLAGGRPEWAATRALVQVRPQGFGAGVAPSWTDLQTGRAGLASINVDAGGYTTNYMFGGGFELHSILADLWVSFGWIGFALGVVVVVGLLRSLGVLIAERSAATSVIFMSCLAIWFMCFGPIYANWLDVCFALGIALVPRLVPAPPDPVKDLRTGDVPLRGLR